MLSETECPRCERPVIIVDSVQGRLTVDRDHVPDGTIIIRADKATELESPARAKKLLEKLGVAADRHRHHRCRGTDVNRVRHQRARRDKQKRRDRAERRATAADAG